MRSTITAMALLSVVSLLATAGCPGLAVQGASAMDDHATQTHGTAPVDGAAPGQKGLLDPLPTSEEEWRALLTDEQYRVLREGGTERAFTGPYWDTEGGGEYRCAACGYRLFTSGDKYDSGSGWPSFVQPLAEDAVSTTRDASLGVNRTEVTCTRCGSHLGHVFPDGPPPTGLRYCINSVSLRHAAAPAPSP